MLQANERRPLDFPRRVKGRWALERSARSLLLRVHRFGRCRAVSREDLLWCARAIDSLTVVLNGERPEHGEAPSGFADGESEE
jgi:hypothetical protein